MSTRGTILIADDEALARQSIAEVLQEEGYQTYEAADGQAALNILEQTEVDVVLSDLKMPKVDGLGVLQVIRDRYPQTMVLLMTAYASIETVVEALRLGAQDYLLKPLLVDDVLHRVRRLLEHKRQAWEIQLLRREVSRHFDSDGMVGRSAAIQALFELTKKVAPTNATVLITGESGVGKEVVARLVHKYSLQKDHVFLPVNCSAIPDTLLESQLFGHTKGAFTGAVGAQEGLFQRCAQQNGRVPPADEGETHTHTHTERERERRECSSLVVLTHIVRADSINVFMCNVCVCVCAVPQALSVLR